jgi:hypothetical protein
VAGPALFAVLEEAVLLAAPQAASRFAAPEAAPRIAAPEAAPRIAALEAAPPIAEALTTVVALTAAPITAAPGSSLAQRSVSQSALRRLRLLTTRRPIMPLRRIAAITAIHPVNWIGFQVRTMICRGVGGHVRVVVLR